MNEQKKIKLGIFCPEPFLGGEMVYINSIIEVCSEINNIVEIVLFTNQEFSCSCNRNNISVIIYRPEYPRYSHNSVDRIKKCILHLLEKSKFINLARKRLPVDVLIFPYMSYDLLRIKNPYIINPQDLRHKHSASKLTLRSKLSAMASDILYRRVMMRASSVVVDSDYNKQDLIKYYNVPEGKMKIIHSLPDITALKSLKEFKQQGRINKYNISDEYIYYPAHLIEAKNHLNLLDALRIIKEKHGEVIPLILSGGKQTLLSRIQERAKDYGISVRYLGYIDYTDVILILKKAKALVFASLFDPYALPIWEAFYLGVPVVSSNVCGLPEQVGNAGLLFDPNNINDMAEKIYRIWIDENMRKELVKRGYDRIKNLTLENYAKQWERVIEETLDMAERR